MLSDNKHACMREERLRACNKGGGALGFGEIDLVVIKACGSSGPKA